MKREDMVNLIFDTIQDSDALQYGEFKKLSEQILERMEERGILPPKYKKPYVGPNAEYLGEQQFEHVHEWEEE